MRHFIGAGLFLVLALVVRLVPFSNMGVDIFIHDTYRVIPLRIVTFWPLIGIASVWFLIAVAKFSRHRS
jgi:hypothetical protein